MAQRTTSKGGAGKAASKASVREAASNGPVGDGIDPDARRLWTPLWSKWRKASARDPRCAWATSPSRTSR